MRKKQMAERMMLLERGHDRAQEQARGMRAEVKTLRKKVGEQSNMLAFAQERNRRLREHLRELIVEHDGWRADADAEVRRINRQLAQERDRAVEYAHELANELRALKGKA